VNDRVIAQAIRRWLLTMETRAQFQVTSCEIRDVRTGTGAHVFSVSSCSPANNQPTLVSYSAVAAPKVCHSPERQHSIIFPVFQFGISS
jgi:hypothetical protein